MNALFKLRQGRHGLVELAYIYYHPGFILLTWTNPNESQKNTKQV